METRTLEFTPVSSSINPSFWNKLAELKLNVDKLNQTERSIWGFYTNINSKSSVPILEVDSTSFNSYFDSQKIYIPFHGRIINKNTIEQFKECDKANLIDITGRQLLEDIKSGSALEIPAQLNQFLILSYADLKKYQFYYWFAFPVPNNVSITCNLMKHVTDVFDEVQIQHIMDGFCDLDNTQKPYFLLQWSGNEVTVHTLQSKLETVSINNYEEYYFAFYDISLDENCPGSLLRNFVTLILYHRKFLMGKAVNFLSFRLKRATDCRIACTNSLILKLEMPECIDDIFETSESSGNSSWVGWERNERGKLGPRVSNMKSSMDPKELAENSVDLNLKLMKWRLLTNIDLDKIKNTKCLLLGSGTLGCSVARILMGWGVRHLSFVDNSTVSYSNPVRQSLFTFEDSKIGKPKSLAAADNVRTIFPGVKSKSIQLSIPMPGHPTSAATLAQVKQDVETLTAAIESHDVIFLLMDSRESRWLPTLLGAYHGKLIINAALGFDTYLVMRHGVRLDLNEWKVRQHPEGFKSLKGNELGCYFCNDVTAPGNSLKDRTLDQQCTVTRPGVSAIAGALAAELAISLLQHKEGAKAPAFYQVGKCMDTEATISYRSVLGLVPHTIRGYLSNFSQILPAAERYKQCVACSEMVLNEYEKRGFEFLLEVFENSKYLEDLTGITEMTKEAEAIDMWEFSDEEEVSIKDYEQIPADEEPEILTLATGKSFVCSTESINKLENEMYPKGTSSSILNSESGESLREYKSAISEFKNDAGDSLHTYESAQCVIKSGSLSVCADETASTRNEKFSVDSLNTPANVDVELPKVNDESLKQDEIDESLKQDEIAVSETKNDHSESVTLQKEVAANLVNCEEEKTENLGF